MRRINQSIHHPEHLGTNRQCADTAGVSASPRSEPLRAQCPTFGEQESHENLQRLQLLKALGHSVVHQDSPTYLTVTQRGQRITAWLEAAEVHTFTIVNIGARLSEKQKFIRLSLDYPDTRGSH